MCLITKKHFRCLFNATNFKIRPKIDLSPTQTDKVDEVHEHSVQRKLNFVTLVYFICLLLFT